MQKTKLLELIAKHFMIDINRMDKAVILRKIVATVCSIISLKTRKETCNPRYVDDWSEEDFIIGHQDVVALILSECLGGKILYNQKYDYYWIKLTNGEYLHAMLFRLPSGSLLIADEELSLDEMITKNKDNVAERFNALKNKILEAFPNQ